MPKQHFLTLPLSSGSNKLVWTTNLVSEILAVWCVSTDAHVQAECVGMCAPHTQSTELSWTCEREPHWSQAKWRRSTTLTWEPDLPSMFSFKDFIHIFAKDKKQKSFKSKARVIPCLATGILLQDRIGIVSNNTFSTLLRYGMRERAQKQRAYGTGFFSTNPGKAANTGNHSLNKKKGLLVASVTYPSSSQ